MSSKVIGIDWSKAAALRGVQFRNCELSQSNFSFCKLPQLIMKDCITKDSVFTEADCTNANFSGTDFAQTLFSKANLTGADFRRAFNYGIDFRFNTIKNAKFSLPEAASLLQALEIELEG